MILGNGCIIIVRPSALIASSYDGGGELSNISYSGSCGDDGESAEWPDSGRWPGILTVRDSDGFKRPMPHSGCVGGFRQKLCQMKTKQLHTPNSAISRPIADGNISASTRRPLMPPFPVVSGPFVMVVSRSGKQIDKKTETRIERKVSKRCTEWTQ